MKNKLLLPLLSIAFLQVSSAQQKPAEDAEKQVPTSRKGLESTAGTAARAVKPLGPEATKRLEKIKALHAKQAKFHKDVASGKTVAFPEINANWQKYLTEATRLGELSQAIHKEKDPARKRQLQRTLSLAIQPIGWLMEEADFVVGYVNTLNQDQSKELKRLEAAFVACQGRNQSKAIVTITPGSWYTFTYLPVEMRVTSAPNTKVYLKAPSGGLFPNYLNLIELTTNDKGVAFTEWITRGDAIAGCYVEARSNYSHVTPVAKIEVVKPVLSKPFTLAEVKAAAKAAEAHTK